MVTTAVEYVKEILFKGGALGDKIDRKYLGHIRTYIPYGSAYKFIDYVLSHWSGTETEELTQVQMILLAEQFDKGYNPPDERNQPNPEYDHIRPDHYKAGGSDVIAFSQYHELSFDKGNVVKYVTRAGKKPNTPELTDLYKAREYLNRAIELAESKADQ